MKLKILSTVATIILIACTNEPPSAGERPNKPGYGKPDAKPEIETMELTPEVKRAIKMPEAALLAAFDKSGKVVLFELKGTKDATYPVEATSIRSLFSLSVSTFYGSHCVDRVDSTGAMRRVCYPPHP